MTPSSRAPILLALALLGGLATQTASAEPGRHPYYVHALTDLRDARWNLEHRAGDAAISAQEDVAIREVDAAIAEARRAAEDDGRNLADRPHTDAALDHPGRLHHAFELLRQAQTDVRQEEDDASLRELRLRVNQHVDNAIHATERALYDVEHHR